MKKYIPYMSCHKIYIGKKPLVSFGVGLPSKKKKKNTISVNDVKFGAISWKFDILFVLYI